MQLSLLQPERPRPIGRGGARPGAGRPRRAGSESHRRRPEVSPEVPQHVTLRVAQHVWNLRAERCFGPIRRALAGVQQAGFRVVHYAVQGNHLHLLVEASGRPSLTFGLRALTVRVARALNRVMGRTGKVLSGRAHVRALRSPTEVKNALRYVLLNHNQHVGGDTVDPCSTAPWFHDWSALDVLPPRPGPWPPERVDRAPRTWLLATGYRRRRSPRGLSRRGATAGASRRTPARATPPRSA